MYQSLAIEDLGRNFEPGNTEYILGIRQLQPSSSGYMDHFYALKTVIKGMDQWTSEEYYKFGMIRAATC